MKANNQKCADKTAPMILNEIREILATEDMSQNCREAIGKALDELELKLGME